MITTARASLDWALARIGLKLGRLAAFQSAQEYAQIGKDIETVLGLVLGLPVQYRSELLANLRHSRAQLKQDIFALAQLNFKKNGYFVDLGATNGISGSNTYLLEKQFGWQGILVEPAKCWHRDLKKNRTATIETSCVWSASGAIVPFREMNIPELSTIDSYGPPITGIQMGRARRVYPVQTISLNDLLKKHNAPSKIDYLSIDTEGSEYEILSNLNFAQFEFKVITCEHNFKPTRQKVFDVLQRAGYVRKLVEVSQFEDWYVKTDCDFANQGERSALGRC